MWLLLACRGALVADEVDRLTFDSASLADTDGPTAPAEPVVPLDGPPPIPEIAIANLLPGQLARVTVAPVRAGARVRIAFGDGEGDTCVASGLCFDIAAPLRQIAEGVAGDEGYAELFVTVPPDALGGRVVRVQALVDDEAGPVLSTGFDRRIGPSACGQTYKAVCGWDGSTWSNRCAAAYEGWVTRWDGPC